MHGRFRRRIGTRLAGVHRRVRDLTQAPRRFGRGRGARVLDAQRGLLGLALLLVPLIFLLLLVALERLLPLLVLAALLFLFVAPGFVG